MTRRLIQAGVAVLVAVASSGQARADDLGVYTVRACPMAGGVLTGWTSGRFELDSPIRGAYAECQSGVFGVDLGGGALPDGASASWTFRAPPFSYLSRVTWERRVRTAGPVVYDLFASPGDMPLESSVATRAPEFAASNGLWESRFVNLVVADGLTARLRCEAGSGGSCPFADRDVAFRGVQIDIVDGMAPIVVSGVVAPESADTLTLNVSAIDFGSGVESLAVFIDGNELARSSNVGGSCALPYLLAQPCPASALASVNLPRAVFAAGSAQVRFVATDAAGNTHETTWPLRQLGYGAPEPATPAPGPATPSRPIFLSASFAGAPPSGPTTYAKPPTIQGVVRDEDGTPRRGTTVQIETRPLVANSAFVRSGAAVTDASGGFTWKVPRGPSREIRFTAASPGGFSSAALQVSVRAPIGLKTNRTRTRNRRTVRFGGTIADAPADARTRVELQAWAGRWVPFANATVRRGRFSARYTFKRTLSPTTYRFRAVLPSDPNFPYAPATSKEVRVRVVP
jgi:hypothetical protein